MVSRMSDVRPDAVHSHWSPIKQKNIFLQFITIAVSQFSKRRARVEVAHAPWDGRGCVVRQPDRIRCDRRVASDGGGQAVKPGTSDACFLASRHDSNEKEYAIPGLLAYGRSCEQTPQWSRGAACTLNALVEGLQVEELRTIRETSRCVGRVNDRGFVVGKQLEYPCTGVVSGSIVEIHG